MALIKKKSVVFISLGVLLSVILASCILYHSALPLCRAELVTIKRAGNMEHQVTSASIDIVPFDSKKGIIQVFGEVFESGERYRIIRRAYFNYRKLDGLYLFYIEKRDRSPLDNLADNRIIPPFNMDEEVVVFEVSRLAGEGSKYIFKQFGVPMFVCVGNN